MVQVAEVGFLERHGDGWKMPSASVQGASYFVSGDLRRCSCPGWAFGRGRPCRHLRLVREMMQESTLAVTARK